jgi:hypothetical protein
MKHLVLFHFGWPLTLSWFIRTVRRDTFDVAASRIGKRPLHFGREQRSDPVESCEVPFIVSENIRDSVYVHCGSESGIS